MPFVISFPRAALICDPWDSKEIIFLGGSDERSPRTEDSRPYLVRAPTRGCRVRAGMHCCRDERGDLRFSYARWSSKRDKCKAFELFTPTPMGCYVTIQVTHKGCEVAVRPFGMTGSPLSLFLQGGLMLFRAWAFLIALELDTFYTLVPKKRLQMWIKAF